MFGNTAATSFTLDSDTQITATAPAEVVGVVDITVAINGVASPVTANDQFTYVGPLITSISPSSGPMTGGTVVTITGFNFTGATAVMFGSTAATNFTLDSDTQITATAPAETGGPVDITVTTADGTSAAEPDDQFTFVMPSPISTLASFSNGPQPFGGLVEDSNGNLFGTTSLGGPSGDGTVFEVVSGSETLITLASFTGDNGANPEGNLVLDSNGNLFGTTSIGGSFGDGTVFEVAFDSGTITTLASFNGDNGSYPNAGLVLDSSGNLFGTAFEGGPFGDGTVFEIGFDSGTITTLASFNSANGALPQGGLIEDSSGNLFGTTLQGGPSGDGTVFEVAQGSGAITTLASFTGQNAVQPQGGLVEDSSGNLFGTTSTGGPDADGTVFEVAQGSGAITTLASFTSNNGFNPNGGLVEDSSGNLFGTTSYGNGDGTVFEVAQGSGAIATLASFTGDNGSNPFAGLIQDSSGNLFGTTLEGGLSGDGTVFEVAQGSGTITTLASFNGANRAWPQGGLVEDSSGDLFGTTSNGGLSNDGTVFEVAAGSGTVTTLASFNGANGAYPTGGLFEDSSGNFFGTTTQGGLFNDGTVFEVAAGSGTITTLVSFNGDNGAEPQGGLVVDSNGNLFGTTSWGGSLGGGTVFEWNQDSGILILASFASDAGFGSLVEDSSGNLFGTTEYGGSSGDGMVFEVAQGSEAITTLVSFTGGADGANPQGGLVEDSSGNLFGTTYNGGPSGDGTVFEVAAGSGTLTNLASFNGANGANPYAGLIEDSSGNLFGTTSQGSPFGDGTVFEVASGSGTITTLSSFTGVNGANPQGSLIEDNSGNLFGTSTGGPSGAGTVFEAPSTSVTPVVTPSTAPLAANATSLTIGGYGFDATMAHDSVTFDDGVTGTVTGANLTSLTVSVSGLSSLTIGTALHASVTVDGLGSGSLVQVATIVPVVTPSTANLAANATSLTISGYGFDTTLARDSVTFDHGVTGRVTSASLTDLILSVSGLSSLTGGTTLHASVTVDGVSSGSPVQVATIVAAVNPVVTPRTANLAANATLLTISGTGFDNTAAYDSVTFTTSGVTGTVTAAKATSLTVSVTGLSSLTAGTVLKASVTVDGVSSGSAVAVATIAPVVTPRTAALAANATSLTISGYGFDATKAKDIITFDHGVIGTVTSASPTSLTVSVSSLSSLTGGMALHASVKVDGVSSSSAVAVATIAPMVTPSTATLAANATTLIIHGFDFSSTASDNTVTFSDGATGKVTSATATKLTVTSLSGLTVGSLTATVTSNSVSSTSAVQVATVIPVVTTSTASLGVNATTLIIDGFGFDTTAAHDVVSFGGGVTGTVSSAKANQLTVTNLSGLKLGALTASVKVDGQNSGPAVQVATVKPVVTASTAALAANATTLIIHGLGFSSTAISNTVTFSGGAIGKVTSATATQLTVANLSGLLAGSLSATVTVSGLSSAAVQVATVEPVVTASTANLAANATTLIIHGLGFSSTASDNIVTFSDGATGKVTSATATKLTVASLSGLTVGSLTATVTSNSVSSTSAVQVATVIPVVTISTASLGVNATFLIITGFGFDTTAANDVVSFGGGVTGTVSSAKANQLTVTNLSGLKLGALTASVKVDGQNSGPAVQVATVKPVVTASTATLAANATTLTIQGFGFSSTATSNTVAFSNGVTGKIASATATQLTVTNLSGLLAGSLSATVTVSGFSSLAVQVATVEPVVTFNTVNLAANATTLIIYGFGFSSTASDNSVTFSGGATGKVTSATATKLTVASLSGLTVGSLTATVTSNSVSSTSAVQVATVIPVVTTSTASLGVNATFLIITGFGFDTTAAHDVVSFGGGVTGTVSSAKANQLTVTNLSGLTLGALTASVKVDGQNSGTAVQVATVKPVVTASTATLAANATTLTIQGFGFSSTATSNTVTFSNGVTGKITSATTTQLTIGNLSGLLAESLSATVTVSGLSSLAVQVATVEPVVTFNTVNLAANATTLIIYGLGFSSTASDNTVTFSDGATGKVTSATTTKLTVTSLSGLTVGSLTATVTSNSVSNTSAVQVATVIPVVTTSTASLGVNATTLIITGFGFDTTAAHDVVSFGGGVTGTVSSATANQLTVTNLSGLTLGALTASVKVDGQNSGPAVQVATVKPVVTASTATLAANATTLTIQGFGFSSTATSNTVTFSNGVTGKVTSATATQLTIGNLSGLLAESLSATVTVSGLSSLAVQVATVEPVVTFNTVTLATNATTLIIYGLGFSSTASDNTVTFSGGATGKVTSATATKLTVTSLSGLTVGSLTATVTSNSVSSTSAVQVATVIPVVTTSTASLGVNATTLIITGFGFDTTAAHDVVSFGGGVTGTVSSATANQLTVTNLSGLTLGALTASVKVDGQNSGTAVQVATVKPVVTASTATLAANATTLTIQGFGFSSTATSNTVTFSNGVTGKVTSATATQLTIGNLSGLLAESLSATVTVSGLSSLAVQVATVEPVVTFNTVTLATNATTLIIYGFGFSSTASDNTVTFSGGATGKVTSATATKLTVTSLSGLTAGSLTAIVTSNGVSSGAGVQVATVPGAE